MGGGGGRGRPRDIAALSTRRTTKVEIAVHGRPLALGGGPVRDWPGRCQAADHVLQAAPPLLRLREKVPLVMPIGVSTVFGPSAGVGRQGQSRSRSGTLQCTRADASPGDSYEAPGLCMRGRASREAGPAQVDRQIPNVWPRLLQDNVPSYLGGGRHRLQALRMAAGAGKVGPRLDL